MSDKNINILDNDFYDPLDIAGDKPKKDYVPKFEKDLAKAGGSLEALSAEKTKDTKLEIEKSVKEEPKPISEPVKKAEIKTAEVEINDDIFEFTQYHDDTLDDALPYIAPPPNEEMDYSIMDFSNDYDEEASTPTENIILEEMAAPTKPKLSAMTDSSRSAAQSLMKQMMMDDLDIEMEGNQKASLEELSDEYSSNIKRTEDLAAKDILDNDEKQLIKERLMQDIGYRPSNVNQKASNTMYNSLIAEKKIKASKKGFSVILLMVMLGVIDSFVIMYKLSWNESQLFSFLAYATALFSIIMFIKSRPAKITSSIFFALETIALIGPGLVKFVLDNQTQVDNYIETIIFFSVAIIISCVICLVLAKNQNVNAYITTNIKEERKKIEQGERVLKKVKKSK